jgi:chitin biosynthesis protein CHS5
LSQIEFPSILLPPSISSGSIVDITVARNHASEKAEQQSFSKLQQSIFETYGLKSPLPPQLRCRNATQTSVVLEWAQIELATADIRSLSLYRDGVKAGTIPRPLEQTSTKLSGLAIDHEYTFHLVLRTSAGVYSSEKLKVRTHKMTDLSGITVTPGSLPPQLRDSLTTAVQRIGAKLIDTVRIDTTHFVCIEGKGREWERAVENNIPVVRPEWIEGCEREGRIVGVRGYYLNADPRLRQVGTNVGTSSQARRSNSQVSAKDKPVITPGIEETSGHQRTDSEPPAPPAKDPDQQPAASRTTSDNGHQLATSPDKEISSPVDADVTEESEIPERGGRDIPEISLPERGKEEAEEEDGDKDVDPNDGSFDDVKL